MNKAVRDMIMRRRREQRDNNYDMRYDRRIGDYDYDRAYDNAYDRAYDQAYDRAYDQAYRQGYDRGYDQAHDEMDGRQGVKYTGRYGIGGSRYYGRRDRGEDDMCLTHEDMKMWKKELSKGEHFSMPQIEQAMRTMDIKPKDYTPEDLCMTANALYSDYSKTLDRIIPKEKEVAYYTSLAKDFLEDDDSALKGSEKLAAYYYLIAKE